MRVTSFMFIKAPLQYLLLHGITCVVSVTRYNVISSVLMVTNIASCVLYFVTVIVSCIKLKVNRFVLILC